MSERSHALSLSIISTNKFKVRLGKSDLSIQTDENQLKKFDHLIGLPDSKFCLLNCAVAFHTNHCCDMQDTRIFFSISPTIYYFVIVLSTIFFDNYNKQKVKVR